MSNEKDMYFVIHNSDGDTTIDRITKSQLEARLNDEDYYADAEFLSEVPDELDTNYWPENAHIIIKGRVIVPKSVSKVTAFEVE